MIEKTVATTFENLLHDVGEHATRQTLRHLFDIIVSQSGGIEGEAEAQAAARAEEAARVEAEIEAARVRLAALRTA